MFTALVDYLSNIFYKHYAVNYVKYDRQVNINDQHNNGNFQVIIESDSPLLNKQNIDGTCTMTLSIDILSFVSASSNTITVQDNASTIAFDVLQYIKNDDTYYIDISNYSLMALTEYSDDNSSGVRLTLTITIPNPVNLCEYESHFIEKSGDTQTVLELASGDTCTNTHFIKNETLNLNPVRLS